MKQHRIIKVVETKVTVYSVTGDISIEGSKTIEPGTIVEEHVKQWHLVNQLPQYPDGSHAVHNLPKELIISAVDSSSDVRVKTEYQLVKDRPVEKPCDKCKPNWKCAEHYNP